MVLSWCHSSVLALHDTTQRLLEVQMRVLEISFVHAAEGVAVQLAAEVAQKSSRTYCGGRLLYE